MEKARSIWQDIKDLWNDRGTMTWRWLVFAVVLVLGIGWLVTI